MDVQKAVEYCLEYHRTNSRENTIRSYDFILNRFSTSFGERDLESISSDEILAFLTRMNEGTKQGTKRCRFALLSAFFNFTRNSLSPELQNPCDAPMLKKAFRCPKARSWTIVEKEVVDEIIFRTMHSRNRLILELMARGGLRVSEVLKLTARDVEERKLILRHPKSGKEAEAVFIPHKVSLRLREYIAEKEIKDAERIFPIGYAAARVIVKKAGELVGIDLGPV